MLVDENLDTRVHWISRFPQASDLQTTTSNTLAAIGANYMRASLYAVVFVVQARYTNWARSIRDLQYFETSWAGPFN
jgi:hypothetical protein